MITLPGAVALIGGILVLASALGSLVLGTRTSILRSTITDQGLAIGALEKRTEAAERSESECLRRQDVLDEKLTVQRELNATLASTLTGAADLATITAAQIRRDRQAIEQHAEIVALLAGLARD